MIDKWSKNEKSINMSIVEGQKFFISAQQFCMYP